MSRPPWFIDELAFAGRENLDPKHVARYDEKEDAGAAEEVALLRRHGLSGDSVLVEFGPGTGQFTVEVAPVCAHVVAVDVSPVMLRALREKLDGHPRVELVQAGFLTYEHAGAPADVAYSRLALHHLPDFWKAVALERIRRILRPGGIFRLVDVAYDFGPGEAEKRLGAWCAEYGEGADGTWGRGDVEEHIRDEHSTFTWLLEPMLERAGFVVENAERSGVMSAYVLRAA
ncbi:methyltransferase family protein [Mumia flava]|uniref:Methyltransferase family protein n=1 Tax=Mumia flava TaxID=1348852 RepID=A0A0B2B7H8_9ACTN|nr:class I SAM-dependent methyltransferase [Mumia flava]PJJ56759.1 methyltransferase family protein [Mumia flava]